MFTIREEKINQGKQLCSEMRTILIIDRMCLNETNVSNGSINFQQIYWTGTKAIKLRII